MALCSVLVLAAQGGPDSTGSSDTPWTVAIAVMSLVVSFVGLLFAYLTDRTAQDANREAQKANDIASQANTVAERALELEKQRATWEMTGAANLTIRVLGDEDESKVVEFAFTNTGRGEIVQLRASVTSFTRVLEQPLQPEAPTILRTGGMHSYLFAADPDRLRNPALIVAYVSGRWKSANETVESWWSIMPVGGHFHAVPLRTKPPLAKLPAS